MSKSTVLIVDDDEDFLESTRMLVDSWGIVNVATAENGLLAEKYILEGHPVDLVVADYMMPDMDGISLKEKLNMDDSYKNIPMVMVSGYGTPNILDMAVGLGIQEWFDKPVAPDKLKDVILKYIG